MTPQNHIYIQPIVNRFLFVHKREVIGGRRSLNKGMVCEVGLAK